MILGLALLFRDNFTKSKMYHGQVLWISIGVILIFLTNAIYISHIIPGFEKDYTPVALALGSLCFSITLNKYRLMGILPIGKTALFEALDDGILVVATDSTIVNINPSAQHLLKVKEEEAIEKPLIEAFPFLPVQDISETTAPKEQVEFCLSERPPVYINLKSTPILDHNKHLRGYLILLHDATHEKLIQISEHKERVFAEALSEIAAALNSAQNLEELLDVIISNVTQVISCDSANIMMIENGYAFAVRSIEPLKFWVKLPVDQTNNLRWMVENRSPMVMSDVRDFPEWVSIPETAGIQSYVGAPIVVVDEVVGFINLDSYTAGFYDQKTAERLSAFANQASIAFRNAQTMKKLEELASTDSLTEIYNRRCFFEMAIREFERAKRYGLCLSTIMIDIDHFKKINDSYGHLAGDQVLRRVAQICVKEIRGTDIIGRYGGEEFAIVLPDTDIPEARIVADRLCQHIAKEKVSTPSGEIGVTSSMGIAALDPACYRLEDLLEHSDIALYLAKHNGRNHAEIFSSDSSLQAEDF
jgi:diguanylate cyclase (GGDEF)-like protein